MRLHGSETSTVMLRDGRTVRYHAYGAADGRPILGLHGTPGSYLKFAAADDLARARGLRIISIDRWGYGGTSVHPAPTFAAFASDCAEVFSQLEIARAGVFGISGGGPFACAVASVLRARIVCAALVSPVGPIVEAGLGWRALEPIHAFAFRVLPKMRWGVRALFAPFRAIALVNPSTAAILAARRAAPTDRLAIRDPAFRRSLGATFAAGLRPGTHGPAIDLELFGRTWDAYPQDVRCPTRIWIGRDDRNVPVVAATRLGRMIPGCETTLVAGAGHYWIAQNFETVLDWIAGHDW
jgi:pimeloyl-ACP methyl ester carboxylesterase